MTSPAALGHLMLEVKLASIFTCVDICSSFLLSVCTGTTPSGIHRLSRRSRSSKPFPTTLNSQLKYDPISHSFKSLMAHADSVYEASLAQSVERLQNAFDTLEATLGVVRTELVQARATRLRMVNARASTIFKLPPEILSMIFELACVMNAGLEERFVDEDDMPRRDRGSISLTCFEWRQVVLATPSLWSDLVVRINEWDYDAEQGWYGWQLDYSGDLGDLGRPSLSPNPLLVPVTLERAGVYPLNIHVLDWGRYSEVQEILWRRLFYLLTPAIEQARVVQIRSLFLPSSLFSSPLSLRKLRYLWLEWATIEADGARHVNLSTATSLCLLSVCIPHDDDGGLFLQLPEAANMTQLTLSGDIAFFYVLAAVTCSAPQLERLYLNIRSEENIQPPTELHLPNLRHLFVEGLLPLTLVPAMIAPQLRSLTIEYSDTHERLWTRHPIPLSNVEQFPCLHDFFVADVPNNILVPFIKMHPSLQRLGTVDADVARQVVLEVSPESRAPFLPNLRELFVECSPILEEVATVRQLAEYIQTARPPNCLLHVHTSNLASLLDTSSDELRKIVDEFNKYICYPSRCRLDMNWKNVSLME